MTRKGRFATIFLLLKLVSPVWNYPTQPQAGRVGHPSCFANGPVIARPIESYSPFWPRNVIRSRTRQEYPHSLSYHAITFTQLPATTSVIGESTMDEKELPLKSEETSSCVSYPRYGARGPLCDAFCNAPFTSSTVVALSTQTTRSTTETFGVGTRIANPCSLPFNSGITREIAFAAPVVVGIIERAAARARRRSLWGKSRITWSLV